MGIQVEYNPDLALRNIREYKKGNRDIAECIPALLEVGKIYNFKKRGQRVYWLKGEIPLLETQGNGVLSKPLASIIILESTHHIYYNTIYTNGKYEVVEIFDDDKIHYNGFAKID